MTKQLLAVCCASCLSLTAIGVTTCGACLNGCKKDVTCFKLESTNDVWLLVPKSNQYPIVAMQIDSPGSISSMYPMVSIYNNCPNRTAQCSGGTPFVFIETDTCPTADQCVLHGSELTAICAVE